MRSELRRVEPASDQSANSCRRQWLQVPGVHDGPRKLLAICGCFAGEHGDALSTQSTDESCRSPAVDAVPMSFLMILESFWSSRGDRSGPTAVRS